MTDARAEALPYPSVPAPPPSSARSWQEIVFKNRGVLVALPALALAAAGKPTSNSIAAGVPLALAGEALRCWAVGYSGVTTRSDRVTAPVLVTAGPYAYVRNPLYLANLITAAGFALAFSGGLPPHRAVLLAAAGLGTMLGVYAAIVPLEEAYLRATFGEVYERYARRVPRVVPRFRPALPAQGRYDSTVIARAETRTFLTFGLMLAALAGKALRA